MYKVKESHKEQRLDYVQSICDSSTRNSLCLEYVFKEQTLNNVDILYKVKESFIEAICTALVLVLFRGICQGQSHTKVKKKHLAALNLLVQYFVRLWSPSTNRLCSEHVRSKGITSRFVGCYKLVVQLSNGFFCDTWRRPRGLGTCKTPASRLFLDWERGNIWVERAKCVGLTLLSMSREGV